MSWPYVDNLSGEGLPMLTDETRNEILGGALVIHQSRRGYRFNLDSLILAHFAKPPVRGSHLDLGCGNGIILLVMAGNRPGARWTGLEIQPQLANLARLNVQSNGLSDRAEIVAGDAQDIRRLFKPASFHSVIFNPPYRRLQSGRINPQEEKAAARHEILGSLPVFLSAARQVLKPSGRVCTIYPASRLAHLVCEFRRHRIEPKRMRLVFSDSSSPAQFVLAEGRLFAREELKVEPPLFIYESRGVYTKDMKDVFTGLAAPPDGASG